MSKTFEQNQRSKEFAKEVTELVEGGLEPSYKVVADKLHWHENALSLVRKGQRNVPPEVYKKYTEVYKTQNPDPGGEQDFEKLYIAQLRRSNELLEQLLKEKEAATRRLEANLAQMKTDMELLAQRILEGQKEAVQQVSEALEAGLKPLRTSHSKSRG
jgi:small-conductance mechanosensitive channel